MTRDNARLAGAENQRPVSFQQMIFVKRKDIFYEQPVVEQEQKRRKKTDEDDRVRDDVVISIVIKQNICRLIELYDLALFLSYSAS